MKVFLVCDIMRDNEMAYLMGFDPIHGFKSLDAAMAWAAGDLIERHKSFHQCGIEWHPVTENKRSFLVLKHRIISKQAQPVKFAPTISGVTSMQHAYAEDVSGNAEEEYAIIEIEVEE